MYKKNSVSQCPLCKEFPSATTSGYGCKCFSILGYNPHDKWEAYCLGAQIINLLHKEKHAEFIKNDPLYLETRTEEQREKFIRDTENHILKLRSDVDNLITCLRKEIVWK